MIYSYLSKRLKVIGDHLNCFMILANKGLGLKKFQKVWARCDLYTRIFYGGICPTEELVLID